MLSKNVPMKIISQRLGHSSIGTTADIYLHVQPVLQAEAASQLDGLFKTATEAPNKGCWKSW